MKKSIITKPEFPGNLCNENIINYFRDTNVEKVILFGSYARGTATKKSDLDLILIKNTEKSFFERYEEITRLYELLGNNIDILYYTISEWENIKERAFFKKILNEGKVIYVR